MDSAEQGLMAGAGNIDSESNEIFNNAHEYIDLKTKFRKWTKEELDGRILVECQASRDGLKPFIDKEQPFETMAEADLFYQEMFYQETDGENLMLRPYAFSDRMAGYEILFFSTEERCGAMMIKCCEVLD